MLSGPSGSTPLPGAALSGALAGSQGLWPSHTSPNSPLEPGAPTAVPQAHCPVLHPVQRPAPRAHNWSPPPSPDCGLSLVVPGRYLSDAVAGVEEDGRVRVYKAIFEGEEPLCHIVLVVTGEACGGGGRWSWAGPPWLPGAQTAPHPSSQRLTLVAQLEVEQGVDTAHGLLAGGRPQVRTPWGEEADEEAQVVEGHQGLERRGGRCCGDTGGRGEGQPERGAGALGM